MARTKQREIYGSGSVTPVTVPKVDGDGNNVLDASGKPAKVQKVDRTGKPVWRVCISLGTEEYVDADGRLLKRQRKVQRTYHGTLRDARAYCKELSESYDLADAERSRSSFSAMCEAWSQDRDYVDCSAKQLGQYMRLLGYVAPYLDNIPLVEIRKADVNAALKKAVERPGGKRLADTSAAKMRKTVYRVFEYAVDEDYIAVNPCRTKRARRKSATATGGKPIPQRRALSEDEASRLCAYLDAMEERAYKEFAEKEERQDGHGNTFGRSSLYGLRYLACILATRLLLATGVRRGEAMGLVWGNVDLDAGTVRVAQTLNETMDLKRPKTDNGIRSMFIDDHTVAHLRRWKEFQARYLHLVYAEGVAVTQTDETPVFCNDIGGWIDPTNYSTWWRSFREDAGFDKLLTHELRHTQVTLLRGNGIPEDMIKIRVGHAHQSSVTWGYTHEMPANDPEAARVMGEILYEGGCDRGVVLPFTQTA